SKIVFGVIETAAEACAQGVPGQSTTSRKSHGYSENAVNYCNNSAGDRGRFRGSVRGEIAATIPGAAASWSKQLSCVAWAPFLTREDIRGHRGQTACQYQRCGATTAFLSRAQIGAATGRVALSKPWRRAFAAEPRFTCGRRINAQGKRWNRFARGRKPERSCASPPNRRGSGCRVSCPTVSTARSWPEHLMLKGSR